MNGEIYRGGKRAVSVSEKDRDVVRELIRNGQVLLSVAVEIAHRHRVRTRSGRVIDRGAERTAAVAEKDRDVIRAEVGHGEIGVAITIKVADGDSKRLHAGGEIDSRRERAAAGGQKNGNAVRAGIGDSKIAPAVMIQVADCDRRRTGSRCKRSPDSCEIRSRRQNRHWRQRRLRGVLRGTSNSVHTSGFHESSSGVWTAQPAILSHQHRTPRH